MLPASKKADLAQAATGSGTRAETQQPDTNEGKPMTRHVRPFSIASLLWRRDIYAFAGVLISSAAYAVPFETGDFSGSFDTEISWGTTWRVQGRDPDLLGLSSTTLPNGTSPPGSLGGRAYSVNGDDGNLNYGKGLVSNVIRLVPELEINHKSGIGAFGRVRMFYDFENKKGDREKIDLTDQALELVGSDIKLLDAYVYGKFQIKDRPGQVRIGNQVVSWGENTFIPNGINVINPIDVPALRSPGSELRDALLPVPMIWGTLEVAKNHSIEAFYQLDWERVKIDPSGSYFGTNDFAADGGNKLMLGFGRAPDILSFGPAAAASAGATPVGVAVPRGPDNRPGNSGQFGVAYRTYVESLHDSDLGFYFINYHSRLPVISAVTGTPAGLASGDYVGSARYIVEYPEDIKLFGASFNTTLGTTDWAIQGEISHKRDVPLQVDDVELLYAALSPLALAERAAGAPGVGTLLASTNQVVPGGAGFGTYIPGFIRRNVTQVQATATRLFPHVLAADQLALVGEIGAMYVHNMPSQNELRLEVPGTYVGGNRIHTIAGVQPATEPASNFADEMSWGYQIRARLTYNNAIGPVALIPDLAFAHDFSGNSPGPGGPFLEGRKALSLGLTANLRNEWTAEVRYTNFFGAGRLNLINDRDFISFIIKYSR